MDLAELADRIEIRELTARYNNAIDDGRLEEFLELFTEDAIFEVAGTPPAKGKAEIAALVAAFPPVTSTPQPMPSSESTAITPPSAARWCASADDGTEANNP